jgi:hypothetical protein
MSTTAKILSLSYDSVVATKSTALKSYWRSVRLLKNSGAVNPKQPSYITNILLCGNCIDPENRNLYVFYIDTYYHASWIIEIKIDSRVQTVVYYDQYNAIGFDAGHKIYNARVVHGRIIWTDNLNPIYQMDIARAKKSFSLGIGYGQNTIMAEWSAITPYSAGRIVSNGNNFYQAVVYNIGIEPRLDDGTHWNKLCLIEDAYYSMNVQNFYFEPMPPKHPPVVTYQSDDTRKINNLRQTLFQVAYRYVYMDWRKSTYSPASIVPVPQAEEETATGLANEQISLNNKLQIVVNSGGEEVRAIEVIGRSSQDVAHWFLIDTINKFEVQERGNEISLTTNAVNISLGLSIEDPTVVNESVTNSDGDALSLILPSIVVVNTYVSSLGTYLNWSADQWGSGPGVVQTRSIFCNPNNIILTSKPDWLTILDEHDSNIQVNWNLNNGDVIRIFPTAKNTGGLLTGTIVLTNAIGDSSSITVTQLAYVPPPPVPITCNLSINVDAQSYLTLVSGSASAMSASRRAHLAFKVNHSGYATGDPFTLYWRAEMTNPPFTLLGTGSFPTTNNTDDSADITLTQTLLPTDVINIYLSAAAHQSGNVIADHDSVSIAPMSPTVVNTQVSSDTPHLGWIASQYGTTPGVPHVVTITSPPVCAILDSAPSWLTLKVLGWDFLPGMSIPTGETITVYPTAENLGNALTGSIILHNANNINDTASIPCDQAAAITPPPGVPISCTALIDAGEPAGLTLSIDHTVATSGSKNVSLSVGFAYKAGRPNPFTLYWKATVNGVVQGRSSVSCANNTYNGTIVLDITLLAGDVVIIYLSTVYI